MIHSLLTFTSARPFSKETRDTYHHTRELYWDDDVHAVARKWKALKAALHTQRGQEELETWKNERLAHVALCEEVKHALKATETWCTHFYFYFDANP